MSDKSSTDTELSQKKSDNNANKAASDFVVGSITFVAFIIFMIVWMYFQD